MQSKVDVKKAASAIRRRRVIKSCVNCHRRKVKCDKMTPKCGTCVKLNMVCQYYSSPHEELEETSEGEDANALYNKDSATTVVASVEKNDRPTLDSHRLVDAGYLTIDNTTGTSRYTNGAFWGAYFKEITDVTNMLREHTEAHNQDRLSAINNSQTSAMVLLHYLARSSLDNINMLKLVYSFLPDKATSEHLIQQYFQYVRPIMPLFGENYFRRKSQLFWSEMENDESPDLQFLTVMLAVFYSASKCLKESSVIKLKGILKEKNLSNTELIESYRNSIAIQQKETEKFKMGLDLALSCSGFPSHATVYTIQASIITTQVDCCSGAESSLSQTAVLIRLAQIMGIHRDPDNFSGTIEQEEAEARRLMWHALVHLDYVVALTNGLPPVVRRVDSDVRKPSEYAFINGKEDKSKPDLGRIVFSVLSDGSLLNVTILRNVYGVQKCSNNQVRKLDEEIITFREKAIAKKDYIMNTTVSSESDKLFKEWCVNILDAMQFKAYAYLHHPSHLDISDEGPGRKRSHDAKSVRERVIEDSVGALKAYLRLSETPKYTAFAWFTKTFQPFHPMIIVLQDIYINGAVLPRSRSSIIEDERLAIIEQTFLRLHFLGLSEVSAVFAHQWHVLNKLRTGTWLKIGYLNPVGLPLVSSNLSPEYESLVKVSNAQGDVQDDVNITAMSLLEIANQLGNGNSRSTPDLRKQLASDDDSYASKQTALKSRRTSAETPDDNISLHPFNSISLTSEISELPYDSLSSGSFTGDLKSSFMASAVSDRTSPSNVTDLTNFSTVGTVDGDFDFNQGLTLNLAQMDEATSEELFNFAAQMEQSDTWNSWDALLKQ
ncbi:hypothetical protein V1511DRAFT_496378 [Dipodascopsis uninucleata]